MNGENEYNIVFKNENEFWEKVSLTFVELVKKQHGVIYEHTGLSSIYLYARNKIIKTDYLWMNHSTKQVYRIKDDDMKDQNEFSNDRHKFLWDLRKADNAIIHLLSCSTDKKNVELLENLENSLE